MQYFGEIINYNSSGSIAFVINKKSNRNIVYIGGMGAQLLSSPYLNKLITFCDDSQISLYIPQLKSHPNYQIFPIESDIDDIHQLIGHIQGEIILIGHSTGCQDILLYLEEYYSNNIRSAILQAPVSDIESQNMKELEKHITKAIRSGKYYEYNGDIWLTERFLTCFEKNNKEDLFSSYLEDSKFLKWRRYCPVLSVISENDEFCNADLSDKFKLMGKVVKIKNGTHCLLDEESQLEFMNYIEAFLKEIKFI